jgi:hypothetical protein
MSFGVATARFKKALIPRLQSGKPISGVFEEVLGEKGLAADADQARSAAASTSRGSKILPLPRRKG